MIANSLFRRSNNSCLSIGARLCRNFSLSNQIGKMPPGFFAGFPAISTLKSIDGFSSESRKFIHGSDKYSGVKPETVCMAGYLPWLTIHVSWTNSRNCTEVKRCLGDFRRSESASWKSAPDRLRLSTTSTPSRKSPSNFLEWTENCGSTWNTTSTRTLRNY